MQPPIRILMIEDDEDDYLLTLDCIQEVIDVRYAVTWERNGMAAIAGDLPYDKYDVVLVDYHVDRRGRAVEVIKPNGDGVLEARIRPLETGGYTLACIDVSKHKAIEDTLLEAKDEAERLSKAKSLFIARLAHEMRTPCTPSLGLVRCCLPHQAMKLATMQRLSFHPAGGW